MSIYNSGDWFQCSKRIIRDKNISQSAKWLYVVLSALNNHFGKDKGYFSRTNEALMDDCDMSAGTLKRAKNELVEHGYIKVWHNQLMEDKKNGKPTTFRACYYKLLK